MASFCAGLRLFHASWFRNNLHGHGGGLLAFTVHGLRQQNAFKSKVEPAGPESGQQSTIGTFTVECQPFVSKLGGYTMHYTLCTIPGILLYILYSTSAKIGALRSPCFYFLGCVKRRSYIHADPC